MYSVADYKRILSANLRYYMDLRGKTQTDLSNDLKLDKSTVSTWYNGKRLPRMDKVEILAAYLGIEKTDLIEEHNTKEDKLNEEAKEVLEAYNSRSDIKILFDKAKHMTTSDVDFIINMIERIHN